MIESRNMRNVNRALYDIRLTYFLSKMLYIYTVSFNVNINMYFYFENFDFYFFHKICGCIYAVKFQTVLSAKISQRTFSLFLFDGVLDDKYSYHPLIVDYFPLTYMQFQHLHCLGYIDMHHVKGILLSLCYVHQKRQNEL